MNRKRILRELLPLLLPVNSGVHSIIIDDYLDIQAAIRANYLEIAKKAFMSHMNRMRPFPKIIRPDKCYYLSHPDSPFNNPAKYTESFVVYDEEPGYIDKVIWVFAGISSEPPGRLFETPRDDCSYDALREAVRAIFPDVQFEYNWRAERTFLTQRALNCQSLQVFFHHAQILPEGKQTRLIRNEWDLYKRQPGAKPNLFKPPLTRVARWKRSCQDWTKGFDDLTTQHLLNAFRYAVLLLLLFFLVCILHPADPQVQRMGAHGFLWSAVLLGCLLLHLCVKEWPVMSVCDLVLYSINCALCAVSIIMAADLTRWMQENPNVLHKFKLLG